MIDLRFILLFSCAFPRCLFEREIPLSLCMAIKPMKTKYNTCASFNDVCLKKGDSDCDDFLNVCNQCPPHNLTLSIVMNILEILKAQQFVSNESFKSKPRESIPSTLLIIIIFLELVIILIVLLENRFKLCTKCGQNCPRNNSRTNYRPFESRKYERDRENNKTICEQFKMQQKFFKEMIEEYGKSQIIASELKSSKNPSRSLIKLECLFGNNEPVTIEFTNDDLVSHLTDQMKDKSKLSDCMLLLIYNDLYLEEDKPIKKYNLAKGSVIKYCNFMKFENANISIGSSSIKENASDIIEAVRTTQNKSVTLKRYQCSNRNHLIESKAVRTEIIAFQKLKSHPRFVQLYGLYFDDHFLYVEMERMPNKSLREHIKLKWFFPEKSIAKWVKQILDGVSHLHTNNIVHRNLRSSDIYLDEKEDIKINGFDFSKYWMEGGDDSFINQIVQDNSISYRYMSPDFIGGESPIFADDVWSMGAILVELVTGLRPYDDFTELAAMKEISKSRQIVYETPRQGISDNLRNFMDSCLQGNVEDRATAAQLLEHDFMKSHL